jgi:hypothetical protein
MSREIVRIEADINGEEVSLSFHDSDDPNICWEATLCTSEKCTTIFQRDLIFELCDDIILTFASFVFNKELGVETMPELRIIRDGEQEERVIS